MDNLEKFELGPEPQLNTSLETAMLKISKEAEEKGEEELNSLVERHFNEIRKRVDRKTDIEGMSIDSNIKETVVALIAWGFPALASCEGHLTKGRSSPWVRIEAYEKPKEKFKGEIELAKKISKKYNISIEDVIDPYNNPNIHKKWERNKSNEETLRYKEWRLENEELARKAKSLLNKYYKEKPTPENIRIGVEVYESGSFEIRKKKCPKTTFTKKKNF